MKTRLFLLISVVVLAALACSLTDELSPEDIASTMVAETSVAEEAAPQATIIKPAASTNTPLPPTESPIPPPPTQTNTPAPTPTPGPILLSDDFSQPSDIWGECEICSWEEGALRMGPADLSGAGEQHIIICEACGLPINYKMGIDVTFLDGPSEPGRGYGVAVKVNEEMMMIFEINPFQTADLWQYDFQDNYWDWVTGRWTGAIRTGSQTNRVEVEVIPSGVGKSDVYLKINGTTVAVAWTREAAPGLVGLTIYGHVMEIAFDNFTFEELEPYSERSGDEQPGDPNA